MDFQPLISHYFHRLSSGRKSASQPDAGHVEPHVDPLDSSTWPEEWKTAYFKAYPRMPRLDLKPHLKPLPAMALEEALKKRVSCRAFDGRPISIEALSNLLYYSAGIKDFEKYLTTSDVQKIDQSSGHTMTWNESRRFYASGGARYPLEIYPLVLRSEGGLKPSLYHYYVKAHALENIWEKDFVREDPQWLEGALLYPWSRDAAIILFITAAFWRNQIKYGERGYRYILQESGHLGQNIYLVSEALGLQCCALGGFADEEVDKLIDIDGVTESSVYAFAVGPKKEK